MNYTTFESVSFKFACKGCLRYWIGRFGSCSKVFRCALFVFVLDDITVYLVFKSSKNKRLHRCNVSEEKPIVVALRGNRRFRCARKCRSRGLPHARYIVVIRERGHVCRSVAEVARERLGGEE